MGGPVIFPCLTENDMPRGRQKISIKGHDGDSPHLPPDRGFGTRIPVGICRAFFRKRSGRDLKRLIKKSWRTLANVIKKIRPDTGFEQMPGRVENRPVSAKRSGIAYFPSGVKRSSSVRSSGNTEPAAGPFFFCIRWEPSAGLPSLVCLAIFLSLSRISVCFE